MKFLLVRMIFFRSSKNFHSYKKNKSKKEKNYEQEKQKEKRVKEN